MIVRSTPELALSEEQLLALQTEPRAFKELVQQELGYDTRVTRSQMRDIMKRCETSVKKPTTDHYRREFVLTRTDTGTIRLATYWNTNHLSTKVSSAAQNVGS